MWRSNDNSQERTLKIIKDIANGSNYNYWSHLNFYPQPLFPPCSSPALCSSQSALQMFQMFLGLCSSFSFHSVYSVLPCFPPQDPSHVLLLSLKLLLVPLLRWKFLSCELLSMLSVSFIYHCHVAPFMVTILCKFF